MESFRLRTTNASRTIIGVAFCITALFFASLSFGGNRIHPHRTTKVVSGPAVVSSPTSSSQSTLSVSSNATTASASDWRQLGTTTISERQHASIAFNPANSQLIAFGGDNSVGVVNDTWLFDGTRWNRLQPAQSPAARTSASFVYNPDSKTLILFGGDTHTAPNGLLNGTWSFDGTNWTLLQPAHRPPPRSDAAMAYDPVNHEIVLYGGLGDNGFLGDTWTFDGTDWTERTGTNDPSERYGAGMAYDSNTGGIILFGGLGFTATGTTGYLAETWSWKNHQWTQLSPTTSPPGRWEPAMSEGVNGGVTLFGGYADDGLPHGTNTKFNDTWTWNGTTWSQSSATGPGGRYGGAMTRDTALGALALVGGCCNSVGGFYTDTWTFDGNAWTLRARSDAPSVRDGAVMTSDANHANVVLFGGFGGDGFLGDTWIEKNGKWSQLTTTSAPAGRFASNFTYDSQHDVAVLFGGQSGPSSGCSATPDVLNPNHLCDDTWTFNGSAWSRHTPPQSPPYRSLAVMAFDPDTNQTVLFGGYSDQNTLSDTWTWDNTTWTQQSPAHTPPSEAGAGAGLEAAALAWDPLHHQLILFGGEGNGPNGPEIFNETWMWTGSDWQQLNPVNSPPPVRAASLVFDPNAGGLLLIAGQGTGPGTFGTYSDVWLWDGTNWMQLSPANIPPPRYFGAAAFDSALQSTILFGGGGDDGFLDDTWAFGNGAASATPTSTPTVVTSTYLGGSGNVFSGYDITWATATDSNGNVYIAGDSSAPDYPTTANAFQKTYGDGGQDGFVAKFDKNGNLLWSTFLGGSGWDGIYSLAVDPSGNAVVTGVTESSDFPITQNAVQKTMAANTDAAFVTVISADGTQVLYSTFLGGTIGTNAGPLPVNIGHLIPTDGTFTIGVGVAVGNDGTIYVVGGTDTIDMPVTPAGTAAQPVLAGQENGFLARIDTTKTGSAGLIYCTYLGGANKDFCAAVTVDPAGNAFVTGETQSPNFPTTLGAYQRVYSLGTAAFITKLNSTGTSLIYSTLLSGTKGSSAAGGTNYNAPSAITIDSDGHAFVAGETNATDFPTTAGVVQSSNAGQDDGFVTELSTDGSSLIFSTYLGGSDYDGFFGLKLDRFGNIYVGGYTASSDLPLVLPFQSNFGGFIDNWVAELSPGGTTVLFSSYLGGSDQESIYGLDLWNNQLYLGGRTASTDFPVTANAAQKTYGGGIWDNFLTILNLQPAVELGGVVSRKVHGDAGTFDLNLSLTGSPAIECRSGGSNGAYTLVFNFSIPINSVSSVTLAGTGSVGPAQVDPADAHNYIVNLTGVTDAQTITVTLNNISASDGSSLASASASMAVLVGDTNADGYVDSADIAQTKSESGHTVNLSNFREDINADGFIDSADIGFAKSQSGVTLH